MWFGLGSPGFCNFMLQRLLFRAHVNYRDDWLKEIYIFTQQLNISIMLKASKPILLLTILICTIYLTIYYHDNLFNFSSFAGYKNSNSVTRVIIGNFSYQSQYDSHVLYTNGCKIRKFDPLDPSVVKYYKIMRGDINCRGKKYLTVHNNRVFLNKAVVQKDYKGGNFTCTYSPIYRNPKNKTSRADNKFGYGNKSILIFNETLTNEFIKAFCGVGGKITHEEFLASTPIKPSVETRCNNNSVKILTPHHLNVIIIGIDSISKLNFERHFKLTAKFLRQNLSAFEYFGYVKVADNTFPNLTPLLTGHFVKHYFTKSNSFRYFDDLDFIWKNFSSIGYRTLYAEDAPLMGTYNYVKNGFQFPPTDYYFRPFTLAIEGSPWQKASKTDCFQAKPEIIVLYDYLRSFLATMENRPYFAFTWAARLTHDYFNKAGYADKPTFQLLRDISDMGLLNNSMLVFMSDHGIRFGDIRKTFIGKIEERMPFLFLSFPSWFLDAHEEIKANLISNRRRLTTPFDIHETLVDVFQMISKDFSYRRTPYGRSLFSKISPYRDCESAYIHPHWCVCHTYRNLSVDNEMALISANALVIAVNNITLPHREDCEIMVLDAILDAMLSEPENDLLRYKKLKDGIFENSTTFDKDPGTYKNIMVTIRTSPGNAEFESTIRKLKDNYTVLDISRVNVYGKDGDCVEDATMRKYCLCKIK